VLGIINSGVKLQLAPIEQTEGRRIPLRAKMFLFSRVLDVLHLFRSSTYNVTSSESLANVMYLITQFYKDRRAIIVPTLNAYALPVAMIRNIAVTRRPARSLKNTTRENDTSLCY